MKFKSSASFAIHEEVKVNAIIHWLLLITCFIEYS